MKEFKYDEKEIKDIAEETRLQIYSIIEQLDDSAKNLNRLTYVIEDASDPKLGMLSTSIKGIGRAVGERCQIYTKRKGKDKPKLVTLSDTVIIELLKAKKEIIDAIHSIKGRGSTTPEGAKESEEEANIVIRGVRDRLQDIVKRETSKYL